MRCGIPHQQLKLADTYEISKDFATKSCVKLRVELLVLQGRLGLMLSNQCATCCSFEVKLEASHKIRFKGLQHFSTILSQRLAAWLSRVPQGNSLFLPGRPAQADSHTSCELWRCSIFPIKDDKRWLIRVWSWVCWLLIGEKEKWFDAVPAAVFLLISGF